jgi:two-component system cell cycle response regulator CpdR
MSRVLVIDDDQGIRDLLSAYLAMDGHECLTASNGFDGLNLLRQAPVDLVITDLVMKYDGMMTIRVIRWEFPQLGIIAMSGHSKERLDLARAVGADRVLHKPFTADDLKAAMAEVRAIERKG